ncbi:MAG: hypothetical protein K9J16_03000 [Melioribacteraceae bacterium]|nr:hypothetical protein [Melioribacteraceae bacterium]MCF8355467.1 hypothetical protein [Melioribacteraceae bacterium]MCF8392556.1 hypothetical protein [Melioribacteraceae bacterium]MCF8418429.1 hypothetical protein [Melioribacteraceae bacterium]
MKRNQICIISIILILLVIADPIYSQRDLATHTRGKLWETLMNYGFIGSPGAWDYNEVTGIGFYPGFQGYFFPNHEEKANDPGEVTNANFHNFASGPAIMVKDAMNLVPPDYKPKPIDYLFYQAPMAGSNGTIFNYHKWERTENYIESNEFNSSLPEEMLFTYFPTVTGVTVKLRTMQWGFPLYDDFIIYDYTFVNTGDQVITALNDTKVLEQTLNEVWLAFQSGISVSTKGTLNFHYNDRRFEDSAAPAGGFGGYQNPGTDVYSVNNLEPDGKGLFYYSRDYNGGKSPLDWTGYAIKSNWENLLRVRPEWEPELQDPACFGFVFLYMDPIPDGGASMEVDPSHFSVYNDEGNSFQGKSLDFNEFFGPRSFKNDFIYNFLKHDFQTANDGKVYAWYTSSFGPYTLAPGDSIRLVIAEIAGQMDMVDVVKGDPNGYFPDSSIAEIERNVEAVRNAVKWGIGATVDGINLAADVPESPPAPNCIAATTSIGADTAIISVTWDKIAEEKIIEDASGSVFYDGSSDLSGYRIFRGIDGEKRGAWELLKDIPLANFDEYWNDELELYQYKDRDIQFGDEFYYYVQAYNSTPKQWTSANGTVVNNLPELASGDYNMTEITNAQPGPVSINEGWDVFVAPNPYIEGDPTHSFAGSNTRKIEFRNLPEKIKIKIFNIAGELVKTLYHGPDKFGNLTGSEIWDQRSDAGLLVAPGLYIYVLESETEGTIGNRNTGKFMIIR